MYIKSGSIFSLFLSGGVFASGNVAIKVPLTPAGSFEAASSVLQGYAYKEGDQYKTKDVVINLKELKTGIQLRDEHMQNKYLEVEKYPNAVLKSASGSNGDFKGDLEVHGVTKPVTGKYEVQGDKIKTNFKVKMSDFEIAKASYMGVGARDEVNIDALIPIQAAPITASAATPSAAGAVKSSDMGATKATTPKVEKKK